MSMIDRLRYAWWRAMHGKEPLTVRLETGIVLTLWPPPASDLDVAYEIFVKRAYQPPRSLTSAVGRVVDAGANVGFICLYWAQEYPACRTIAFEPHPSHVAIFKKQLALNPGINVDLDAAAACAGEGTITLSGSESSTNVVREKCSNGLIARAEDFFSIVGGDRIDLLKIDIEGGEYEILGDPRFSLLDAPVMVLEWHRTTQRPDGRDYCHDRLRDLGYDVTETVPGADYGIFWAFKKTSGGSFG